MKEVHEKYLPKTHISANFLYVLSFFGSSMIPTERIFDVGIDFRVGPDIFFNARPIFCRKIDFFEKSLFETLFKKYTVFVFLFRGSEN